jgi:Ca2+-dependent lipid-binding protein
MSDIKFEGKSRIKIKLFFAWPFEKDVASSSDLEAVGFLIV